MKAWAPTQVVTAIAAVLCAMLLAGSAAAQTGGATVDANPPAGATAPAKTANMTPPDEPAPATEAPKATETPKAPNPDEDREIGGGPASSGTTGGGKTAPWNPGWLGMLWPLLAVLAGIAVLFWAVRRFLPGMRRMAGNRAVEVLGRTYLSPRQSVTVVKLGRRILVIGQTPENLSALASITDPEEVSELVGLCESAGEHSATASFRKIFQRLDREYEESEDDAGGSPSGDDVSEGDIDRVRSELRSLADKVRQVSDGRKKES